MQIKVTKNVQYRELVVSDGRAVLESGLLDDEERRAMAEHLREIADELLEGIEVVKS